MILKNIENKRENISRLTEKQVFRKPEKLIELNKIDFKYYLERLQESGKDIIVENSKKLELLDARLNALSPMQVMKRGYSMVYGSNGNVVDSIKSLENGEKIQICFSDGTASARIEGLKES